MIARGEDGPLSIFPTDGSAPRRFPKLDSGWRPARWAADSKSFFAFRGSVIPAPVFRVDAATGSMEPWVEISPLVRSGVGGLNSVRITPDGERYVCSYPRTVSALFHARGLR